MALLIYPLTPTPQLPLTWSTEFRTIIAPAESGVEERRQQWRFQKRRVSLVYNVLHRVTELEALWNFYVGRKGSLGPFRFVEPDITPYETYVDEYVGRGDASKVEFQLPARSASPVTMYINGVDVTVSNPYTVTEYNAQIQTGEVTFTDGEVTFTDGEVTFGGGGLTQLNNETDMVTFTNPPSLGAVITADFKGRLAIRSRFAEDKLTKTNFKYILYNIGLEIVEDRQA